jgi:phage I-like protein
MSELGESANRRLANTLAVSVMPPDTMIVCPWGNVQSDSGDFTLDEKAAKALLAAFVKRGVDLPVDYEHATLGGKYSAPDGRAPAAGWIKALRADPGVGIVATVEWTRDGAEYVASKEYRYLSPVVVVNDDDRAVELHSVALTNAPAIHRMSPVVNSGKGVTMAMSEMFDKARLMFGLGEDVTPDDVYKAAVALVEALAAELEAAGATGEKATAEGIAAALKKLVAMKVQTDKPDPVSETKSEPEPAAALVSAVSELRAMKLNALVTDGKIDPAERDLWVKRFTAREVVCKALTAGQDESEFDETFAILTARPAKTFGCKTARQAGAESMTYEKYVDRKLAVNKAK